MKSLTNSSKVVDILNRYEHCISYSALEELETKRRIHLPQEPDYALKL